MNIVEMHIWFRQYAQQMGLQNVRAILPEQIDLLINTSITDTVNQIIAQNIGVTNDRIITDNSKIGQINALRTLYKVQNVNFCITTEGKGTEGKVFKVGEETTIQRIHAEISKLGNSDGTPTTFDYLYIVDLALNYSAGGHVTHYFPIRLIDDAFLADTLNDFILKPRVRTPIAVIYNNEFEIYTDEWHEFILADKSKKRALIEGLIPNTLRISYIAKPRKVAYLSDLTGHNEDCDLPEYLHIDILKHAVDLYRISVSGALSASQQQEQNQQRENVRNNYRNDNNQQQSQ